MKRITGLLCLLFGCISSVNGDEVTMTTWAALENPGSVTALRVLQKNSRSVYFTWKGRQNTEQFEVCVFTTSSDQSMCYYKRGNEDTLTNLSPETAYTIRVRAVRLNAESTIAASGTPNFASATTICERSSVVKALTVSTINSSSVTLVWHAPDKVCGNLSHYEVRAWQTALQSDREEHVRIQWQSATVSNLLPNTAYRFSVAAISTEPSGMQLLGYAENVTATTNPGSITDLRVLQENSRSVVFSWNGDWNTEHFEVCVYSMRPVPNLCHYKTGNEDTRTNLLPETSYAIRVTAVRLNADRTIAAGGTPRSTSAKTICEKSSAVQALASMGYSATSVALRWEHPVKVCGSLVGYEVQARLVASSSTRSVKFIPVPWQTATIDNLEPNTAYTFLIGAVSREPSGMNLNGTAATILATTDPGPVTDLKVLEQNARSLKFNWTAPKNSEFEVCVYVTRPDEMRCRITTSNEETRLNLEPETNYVIVVTTVRLGEMNSIAARGISRTTGASTICETSDPLKLRSSFFTASSSHIALSWNAPTAVCGTVVGITVSYFKRTTINERMSDVQRIIFGASATQGSIASLAANTLYNFTVNAQTREPSGRDTSGASDTVELRTAPSRVKNLKTMRVTSNSFEAQWTAPHEGEDDQLLYHIRLYLLSSNASELKKSFSTSGTSVAIDELDAASAYRLEVTPSNLLTSGTRSHGDTSIINLRTDCTTPFQPAITKGVISSLNLDMQVAWRHDARSCLNISYVIFVTFLNGTSHFETSDQWIVIRDLQPYTSYSIVVSAVRTDGLNRRAFSNSSTVIAVTQADDQSRSAWIFENGELIWAIVSTVIAVTSVSVILMLCVCIRRLRHVRWRKGRLYETEVCTRCSQMTSTVKTMATTDAPLNLMCPLVEHPDGAAAEIESPYTSLQQPQRTSRIYEPLSPSEFQ